MILRLRCEGILVRVLIDRPHLPSLPSGTWSWWAKVVCVSIVSEGLSVT